MEWVPYDGSPVSGVGLNDDGVHWEIDVADGKATFSVADGDESAIAGMRISTDFSYGLDDDHPFRITSTITAITVPSGDTITGLSIEQHGLVRTKVEGDKQLFDLVVPVLDQTTMQISTNEPPPQFPAERTVAAAHALWSEHLYNYFRFEQDLPAAAVGLPP